MKKTLLLIILPFAVLAQHPDSIKHGNVYVDDYAGIYTDAQKQELSAIIKPFFDTVQIALVTVKSLQGYSVQEYATKVFNRWGVGSKSNNGLLVLIAPNEHKAFAATGGAIQGELTDMTTARLQREVMVPEFKKGNYFAGTKNLLVAYIHILSPSAIEYNKNQKVEDSNAWVYFGVLALLLPIGIIVMVFVYRRRKKAQEQPKETPTAYNLSLGYTPSRSSSNNFLYIDNSSNYGSGGSSSHSSGSSSSSSYDNSSSSSSYDSSSSSSSSSYDSGSSSGSDFSGGSSDGGGGGSSW